MQLYLQEQPNRTLYIRSQSLRLILELHLLGLIKLSFLKEFQESVTEHVHHSINPVMHAQNIKISNY